MRERPAQVNTINSIGGVNIFTAFLVPHTYTKIIHDITLLKN